MRIGLVLGAGGVLGGAWLVGGLHALATETGWDPGSAEYLVGTSAGAMIAGLSASGVPPWFMLAHSAGETAESLARPYRYSPAAVLAGWLPQGLISSDPLKQTIRRVAGDGWPAHPNLWIMACDYETGRRVAFGRADAPPASLHEPEVRQALSELPAGAPMLVRRPPGQLAQPPDFGRLARGRWVAAAKAS
jgi:NTE family protein